MAEGLGNHWGPKIFYPYRTMAGPEYGPFRRCDAPETIDVLDAQTGELIGVATRLLARPGGKAPRARRGVPGRARPAAGCSGPRCCGSRRSTGPWPAPRCGRRGARRARGPSPAAVRSGTAGCPCARRSGLAGAAVEQPDGPGLAVGTADGQIAVPSLAPVGAIRVLAAEAREVLLHGSTSVILG
jgi:hypothetical protein